MVSMLGAMSILYLQLASRPRTLKHSDIIFEGVLWAVLLSWTLIIVPHWRHLPTLAAGILLMMLGSFSDLLDEFLKLPKVIPNIVEGILLSGGAATTAIGLWQWLKQTNEDHRHMSELVQRLGNSVKDVRDKATELERLNRELQEAIRVKSDFVNAMSHELRTPLNISIGNIGLLLDGYGGSLSPTQAESLENVQHQSRLLYDLISDVLALGHLDAGKVELQINEASLKEVLRHVRGYAEHLNRENQLDLVWNVPNELPSITTDHSKLEEILQNLIGNAYKFTHKGRIEIVVRDLPDQTHVEFSVKDTGVGIEAQEVDKVFEAFHQNRGAHTGRLDGVGLGLSIVRKYLDLLQGDIWVQSEVGGGSNFTFTLPYRVEERNSKDPGT